MASSKEYLQFILGQLSELEEMLGVLPEEERTVLRTLAESRNWEDAEKAAV